MQPQPFTTTVEVVPPAGPDAQNLLAQLAAISHLLFDGFSVATNPVAKPRMSALALCALIQQKTGKPAILHCTTRDHNRLSLQADLWGARALGIEQVLIATGDFVALGDRDHTSTVRDLDVYDLVKMAVDSDLRAGVVLDHRMESGQLDRQITRLKRKAAAGAGFVVTQPVYEPSGVLALAEATADIDIPIILGILPLRTPRHAEFLHTRVAGIHIAKPVRDRMQQAQNPVMEGAIMAKEILSAAKQHFSGACIMPPFDHFEVMADILK